MRRRVTLSYASADHEDSIETKEDRGTDTTGGRKNGTRLVLNFQTTFRIDITCNSSLQGLLILLLFAICRSYSIGLQCFSVSYSSRSEAVN